MNIRAMRTMRLGMTQISTLMTAGAVALSASSMAGQPAAAKFGPDNPFYAPSTLPFHAPPFDKIKDADYLPAIEAGMEQQLEETRAIADNKAEPTFENTIVAMEKTGQLYNRAMAAFSGVTGANTNPVLQDVRSKVAPKRAAMSDAIYLNDKLFARVSKVYEERNAQHLDPESLRLVEEDYKHFVRAGARLSEADKATLKKMNEEIANLSTAFSNKLLAATKGSMSTRRRPLRLPKRTWPSTRANSVSSWPRPTPVPGWKRVPRWRTIIDPAVTDVPSKILTPRRWALLSRPLRVLPPPLVLDIWSGLPGDRRHLNGGVPLAVAPGTAPTGLVLVDEAPDLGAFFLAEDAGAHLGAGQLAGSRQHAVTVHDQDGSKGNLCAGGLAEELNGNPLALFDALLLTACFDNCVHGRESIPIIGGARPPGSLGRPRWTIRR